MSTSYLKMLEHLRYYEEVILFDNLLSGSDDDDVISYLEKEYCKESAGYPFAPPSFDPQAAAWGATTLYTSAQLLLYRQQRPEELTTLLPAYTGDIDAAAILSADLFLRFLPDIVQQLKMIDQDDHLISILKQHLHTWHYSGIKSELETAGLDFTAIVNNSCVHQLYVDRVIEYKRNALANLPVLKETISCSLGAYAAQWWKSFNSEIVNSYE